MTVGPGSRVGRFRLERALGQGAMGIVYLAVDPEIERHVAIKVIRIEGAGEEGRLEEIRERFLKEAKIAGRLQHPNIVTIYDVGREGETSFIAMEYVEGRPLSRLLKPDVGLADAQMYAIVRQTAEALAHAHDRGVIHRDVKPANILVRADGVVKVTDFGIGKLVASGGSDLTRTGQMVGSPSYMSPEQIKGEKLDGRSDLFALGVVFYEMLTGSRPFPGDSITTLVYQILHTEPRDPLALRADLPPIAREVLLKALAKKREDRYSDARAFLQDLSRLSGLRASTYRDSVPTSILAPAEAAVAGVSTGPSAGAAAPAGAAPVPMPVPGPGSGSHPGAASGASPGPYAVATGSAPTVIVEKRGGAALLFGVAALVLAAAALVYVVLQSRRSPVLLTPATPAASSSAATTGSYAPPPVTAPSATSSAPAPATTSAAVSTGVGAPQPNARVVEKPPREKKPVAPAPSAPPEEAKREAAPPAEPQSAKPAQASREPEEEIVYDNVYRARRGMKFQISPDQARLYVDGKYVGIADDWDDHGGGKVFPFSSSGSHHVRASLPGYQDLELQILITPSGKEVESASDEMKKSGKASYPKIPKVDYATTGPVAFLPGTGDGEVSADGQVVGRTGDFTPAHPLKLNGPMMHDLTVSAGGKTSKTIRILVASTAGKELASVKVKL